MICSNFERLVFLVVALFCASSWASFDDSNSQAPIYNDKLEETKQLLKFRPMTSFEKKHSASVQLERQRVDPNQTHPAMTALQEMWKKGIREQSEMRAKAMSGNIENMDISSLTMLTQSSFHVKKTVFSNHTRLLFVAGLEGSGHHAMKDAMSSCFEQGMCKRTPISKDLSHLHDTSHGLAGAFDTLFHDDEIENLYGHLRELAYYSQSPEAKKVSPLDPLPFAPSPYPIGHKFYYDHSDDHLPKLFVLALDTYGAMGGMASYPNGDDTRSRPIDYPDLVPIVALAEAAGVDMRILLLNRRAKDALYSAERRGFGNGFEPPVMVGAANALLNQMRNLDPQFYLCLDYEDLASYYDTTSLINIGKHLHPQINEPQLRKMWDRLKPKEHVTAKEKEEEKQLRSAAAISSRNEEKANSTNPLQPPTPSNFRRSLRDRSREDVEFLMKRGSYHLWRLNMVMEDTRALCRIHQRYPAVANFP